MVATEKKKTSNYLKLLQLHLCQVSSLVGFVYLLLPVLSELYQSADVSRERNAITTHLLVARKLTARNTGWDQQACVRYCAWFYFFSY